MSSYRDEFWRLQMGSLSVVDGFETNSWPHTHSGCDFKKWWIFMNFRNFHLWVKLLKLWNRPISAGKIWFDIRNKFFDVRTPLYPIRCRWGGHLAYLRHISSKTSIFSVNPQVTFFICGFTAWYPKILKCLPSKSMDPQLSNALSNVLIALLDQKLSPFEVQKCYCYSASIRSIMYPNPM